MEMNMGKFSEKLVELRGAWQKRKKMYWNTRRSVISSKISPWKLNRWRRYTNFLEASGVDVLRIFRE